VHDRLSAAAQPIDQSRFAHIGAADDGHNRKRQNRLSQQLSWFDLTGRL
jgi:hypothetical protein